MKRIFMLVMSLMMFSSTCFAANWIWAASNDTFSYYYDADSATYKYMQGEPIKLRVFFKMRIVATEEFALSQPPLNNGEYIYSMISRMSADRTKGEFFEYDREVFNKAGYSIFKENHVNRKDKIKPGHPLETVVNAAFDCAETKDKARNKK